MGLVIPISGFDSRFNEPYEHWAFLPHPLPDHVDLSNQTWAEITAASHSLGRLEQAAQQLDDTSILQRPILRKEAQSTSALEGTFAPIHDILHNDPSSNHSQSPEIFEVLNYVSAAEFACGYVRDRPLSLQLILETHRLLISGTRSDGAETGKIRKRQVVIGPQSMRVADARFVPPPPGNQLDDGMRALIKWINTDLPLVPPLVAVALAHYQFETLHPFNDGNGRIGRLLMVLHLLRRKVLHDPIISISPWFERFRDDYQDSLLKVSQTGDIDQWVNFFARGIRFQAGDTLRIINELLVLRDRFTAVCRVHNVRGVALEVAQSLITRPVITPTLVKELHSISYPAANAATSRLEQVGIIKESTGGSYGRVFTAQEVIDILEK